MLIATIQPPHALGNWHTEGAQKCRSHQADPCQSTANGKDENCKSCHRLQFTMKMREIP